MSRVDYDEVIVLRGLATKVINKLADKVGELKEENIRLKMDNQRLHNKYTDIVTILKNNSNLSQYFTDITNRGV